MGAALTRLALGLGAFTAISFSADVTAAVGHYPSIALGIVSGGLLGRAIGRWAATGW